MAQGYSVKSDGRSSIPGRVKAYGFCPNVQVTERNEIREIYTVYRAKSLHVIELEHIGCFEWPCYRHFGGAEALVLGEDEGEEDVLELVVIRSIPTDALVLHCSHRAAGNAAP